MLILPVAALRLLLRRASNSHKIYLTNVLGDIRHQAQEPCSFNGTLGLALVFSAISRSFAGKQFTLGSAQFLQRLNIFVINFGKILAAETTSRFFVEFTIFLFAHKNHAVNHSRPTSGSGCRLLK
jgi:hypothetical protein